MPVVVVLLLPVDCAAPYGRRPYGFALPAVSLARTSTASLEGWILYLGLGNKFGARLRLKVYVLHVRGEVVAMIVRYETTHKPNLRFRPQ